MKNKIINYLYPFIAVLSGALISYYYFKSYEVYDLNFIDSFILITLGIFFLTVIILMHILLHEFGHLVCGLLSGYSFNSFRIANIMLIKNDNKISFKKLSIAGTAGQCLLSPPDLINKKIPYILYNLGGGLSNIVLSILFYILHLNVLDKNISMFFLFSSLIGMFFGLSNIIPMKTSLINNDGYNLLSIHNNEEAIFSFWISLKANSELTNGKRLKDLPKQWFYIPSVESCKNNIVSYLAVLYENYLMDLNDINKAKDTIDYILNNISLIGIYESLLLVDKIYCCLISDDVDKAKSLLTKNLTTFMKSMKDFPSVIRTQYSISLLLDNDINKSEKIKSNFNKISSSYPYPGEIESELELIEIAHKKYLEK